MSKSYASREGKKVKVRYKNGRVVDGVIAGCDRDIGLTIVAPGTTNPVYCIIGPAAANWNFPGQKGYARARLKQIVGMIDKGLIDLTATPVCKISIGHNLNMDSCPFNQ